MHVNGGFRDFRFIKNVENIASNGTNRSPKSYLPPFGLHPAPLLGFSSFPFSVQLRLLCSGGRITSLLLFRIFQLLTIQLLLRLQELFLELGLRLALLAHGGSLLPVSGSLAFLKLNLE